MSRRDGRVQLRPSVLRDLLSPFDPSTAGGHAMDGTMHIGDPNRYEEFTCVHVCSPCHRLHCLHAFAPTGVFAVSSGAPRPLEDAEDAALLAGSVVGGGSLHPTPVSLPASHEMATSSVGARASQQGIACAPEDADAWWDGMSVSVSAGPPPLLASLCTGVLPPRVCAARCDASPWAQPEATCHFEVPFHDVEARLGKASAECGPSAGGYRGRCGLASRGVLRHRSDLARGVGLGSIGAHDAGMGTTVASHSGGGFGATGAGARSSSAGGGSGGFPSSGLGAGAGAGGDGIPPLGEEAVWVWTDFGIPLATYEDSA